MNVIVLAREQAVGSFLRLLSGPNCLGFHARDLSDKRLRLVAELSVPATTQSQKVLLRDVRSGAVQVRVYSICFSRFKRSTSRSGLIGQRFFTQRAQFL